MNATETKRRGGKRAPRQAVYAARLPVRGRNPNVTAPSFIRVTNPATGTLLAEVPAADAEAMAAAVARARAAQPAWAALPFAERARALRRLARALRDDPTFLDTLVSESGKPRYEEIGRASCRERV